MKRLLNNANRQIAKFLVSVVACLTISLAGIFGNITPANARTPSDGMIELTSNNWESLVLNSELPVAVYFWASWCGPCRMVSPVIGELAREYEGKFVFGSVDTDDQRTIALQYNIQAMPTTLIFVNGELRETLMGAQPKRVWQTTLDKYVGASTVTYYSISYVLNGGTNYSGAPTQYEEGSGTTINGTPTRSGYTFAGWCTNSSLTSCAMSQSISSSASGNKTFYAKWTPKVLTINLSTSSPTTEVSPTTVYLKYATGWYSDSSATTSISVLETVPNKSGTLFKGFYTSANGGGTQIIDASGNFSTSSSALSFTTSNNTIYAFFAPIVEITLDDGGADTSVAPSSVYLTYKTGWYSDSTMATSVSALTTIPYKTGYEFMGFYTGTNGSGTQIISESGNFLTSSSVLSFTQTATTVYAYFAPIIEITLDDGDADTPVVPSSVYLTYKIGWRDSTLTETMHELTDVPTKTGYYFDGFWTGENGTGTQITDSSGGFFTSSSALSFTQSATTVYAYWRPQYTVSYDCGDGDGTPPANSVATAGLSFTPTTNTCSKSGYAFAGWKVSDTDDIKSGTFTWNYDENKTFTAQWIESQFSVTTTNISSGSTFSFTMSATGTFYISCGDGGTLSGSGVSANTVTRTGTSSATYTCTYSTAGEKTILFAGTATGYSTSTTTPAISFYNGTPTKVASVSGSLGSIFSTLGESNGQQPRFYQTFRGCTNLTTIPANLFSGINYPASYMFYYTFYGCSSLQSIPVNLFFPNATSGVSGQTYMFAYTFYNCTSLTYIPENLFSKITSGASYMFQYTFYGCSNLSGFIPPSAFSGLIENGHPTSSYMWYYTFYSTQLVTSCPTGYRQYITGYEGSSSYSAWNNRVSCEPQPVYEITLDKDVGDTASVPETVYLKYATGWYSDADATTTISVLNTLPTKTDYDFAGFYTEQNGEGMQIIDADGVFLTSASIISFTESATTLYAYFKQWPAVTLSAESADVGVAPSTVYLKYNIGWYTDAGATTSISSLSTMPSKTGYYFNGFWTGENGTGTQVVDSSGNFATSLSALSFTESASTVYADFRQQYTVTYSCGAGNGTPPTTSIANAGLSFTTAANTCSKSGYNFAGWGVSETNDIKDANESFTYNYDENKTLTAQWWEHKFSASTTEFVTSNGYIDFAISATGTFYVDCGNDGALSGSGVSGERIIRTGTESTSYRCTFSTTGAKTIRMGGLATEYSTDETTAAFKFYGDYKHMISSISGNLSRIFPTLGSNDGQSPRFYETFYGTHISSIPENIFSEITIAKSHMFHGTFSGSWISEIPSGLFSNMQTTTGLEGLFAATFYGTRIKTVPENLFSWLTTGAPSMFSNTFANSSLETIPSGLFRTITTGANRLFERTFSGSIIQSIPANLFSSIGNSAPYMFTHTFASNYDIMGSVPSGLFSNFTIGEPHMFDGTFYGCYAPKPDDLFSTITTAAEGLFRYTFADSGANFNNNYIPPAMFAGLIANGSPTATNMWSGIFSENDLLEECPSGTMPYHTGYEEDWSPYVSCQPAVPVTCSAGDYFKADWAQCQNCLVNNYCPGGTYTYDGTNMGITACPDGTFSPAGMSSIDQCGHILHIGDDVLYLRSMKQTTPSLNVKVGDDIFYGNMTLSDVVMHDGTERKLKVHFDNTTYSVYDDTVGVEE